MSDIASATPSTPSAPSSPSPTSAPKASAPTGPGASAPQSAGGPQSGGSKPTAANVADPHVAKLTGGTQPDGAPAKTDTPAETAAKRKYKLKVDGAEQELELGDDEISVRLQKAAAAEKRMQEAAELRKQYKAFVDQVKNDPIAALKDPQFGVDVRKLVEEQLIAEFEQSQKLSGLSPQERAAAEKAAALEKELQQYKQREAQVKAEQQRRAQAELEAKVQAELERDFMSALDKSGLPKNRQMLALMAEIAEQNLQYGLDLTPDQMAAEANDRVRGQQKHIMSSLKGDDLVRYLGDEIVREVIRHSVSKVKPGAAAAKPFEPPAPNQTPQKFVDEDDEPRQARNSRDLRSFKKYLRGE